MKLLIINPPGRNVTGAIRSLAKVPYPIEINIAYPKAPNKIDKKYSSKHLKKIHFIPNPINSFEKFKKSVLELIKKEKYKFLLPFGFETTVGLSQFKKEIEKAGAILPTPDLKTVLKIHDKEVCNNIATKAKLPIPKMHSYKTKKELLKKNINYPVVVKARRNSGIAQGLKIVQNKKELEEAYNELEKLGKKSFILDFSKPIVQEYVDGDIYDANFFVAKGEVKSFVFQRRIRSLNNNLGGGIINETLNNKLKKEAYLYGKKLLQKIGWEGSCQVELIYDKKEKKFKLIEINPKLWGTLEISIKAGVDFPLNMLKHYYFKEQVKIKPYKSIKFYWFFDLLFSKLIYKAKLSWFTILGSLFRRNEINLFDWKADYRNVAEGLQIVRKKNKKIIFLADAHRKFLFCAFPQPQE